LLAACFVVLCFEVGRQLLPMRWSLFLALSVGFGTQIWSTASRELWSHTWFVVLVQLVILELVRWRLQGGSPRSAWLATLVSWAYFVRPTGALVVVAVSGYLVWRDRRGGFRYLLTGSVWGALFVLYSWIHFDQLLPSYYSAGRIGSARFLEALLGNMISPARGLLIYVPLVLFLGYLLARHWRALVLRDLAVLAIAMCAAHWLVISTFRHWWGGYAYGPRLLADIVPWLSLLGALAVRAWLDRAALDGPSKSRRFRLERITAATLLLLSIGIHGVGAWSERTDLWNTTPVSVDERPERLWEWADPQFMAWTHHRDSGPSMEGDGRESGAAR
jgi:hypothetical protein